MYSPEGYARFFRGGEGVVVLLHFCSYSENVSTIILTLSKVLLLLQYTGVSSRDTLEFNFKVRPDQIRRIFVEISLDRICPDRIFAMVLN